MAPTALSYSLKVWISSVLIGPLLVFAVLLIVASGPVDWGVVDFILYFALFAFAFSIPSFFLLWIGSSYICRTVWPAAMKRLMIALLALSLTALAFIILIVFFWMPDWSLIWTVVGTYYPVLVAGIFFYRLPEPVAGAVASLS
ncbi:MAG TPA: hypothetical protein VFE32_05050 [Puia sp.]|jgi:hypothetical protein|nr:hypothetical protein [Puia sp.]